MILYRGVGSLLIKLRTIQWTTRFCSSFKLPDDKIRNMAVSAHVDAGKTTTTERMLYYSGLTPMLGEVRQGSTVTDFLQQERDRGITICSAAVTFAWKDHRLNLLDTPGHVDFTMEVEQSLGAVDGTVVVLDASAGVQAQTITVWNQADRYNLPRIAFVNKMDNPRANFNNCLSDLRKKLDCVPVALQFPVITGQVFTGTVDVIELKELRYDQSKDGRTYSKHPLSDALRKEAAEHRLKLIDELSAYDDQLAEHIINNENMDNVDNDLIRGAIRRATIARHIVPVLLGAALRNVGVQHLMNAIIAYLPAPSECDGAYKCFGDSMAARVFKVMHDKERGALSVIRMLNGTLKEGDKIKTSSDHEEVVREIYEPFADDYLRIHSIGEGNVAICSGLTTTSTGDFLVSNMEIFEKVKNQLRLKPVIPDPVYFCSIEAPSLSHQLALDNALARLQREDPSFRVHTDESTMQTVLGGMGELHLDIIKSRILTEYKVDADLGPLRIAYSETINETVSDTFTLKKDLFGKMQDVTIEMTLTTDKQEPFSIRFRPEDQGRLKLINPKYIKCIKKAVLSTFQCGILIGGRVIGVQVILNNFIHGKNVAETFVASATAQCIQHLLRKAACRLLEPLMQVDIVTPTTYARSITSQLMQQRADIGDPTIRGETTTICAIVPLAELKGYSSTLRQMSAGMASLTMQPAGFASMSSDDQYHAIRRAQGLE